MELYLFNPSSPGLSDPRVREALSLTVDRDEIVSTVLRGEGAPAGGLIPPLPGYLPLPGEPPDPDRGRKLLAEAGYPGGEGFPTLTIVLNASERHAGTAGLLRQQWEKALGIRLVSRESSWSEYVKAYSEGDYDIVRVGFEAELQDPVLFIDLLTRLPRMKVAWLRDLEALIEESIRRTVRTEVYEVLRRAENLLISQYRAVLPVYYYGTWHRIDTDEWEGFITEFLGLLPSKNLKFRTGSKRLYPLPWPQAGPPLPGRTRSVSQFR